MGLYFLTPGAGLRPSELSMTGEASAFAVARRRRISTGTRRSRARTCCISRASPPRSARAPPKRRARRRAPPQATGRAGLASTAITARSSGQAWDSDLRAILTELVGHGGHPVRQPPRHLVAARARVQRRRSDRRRDAAEAAFAAFPALKLIASTARHVVDADTTASRRGSTDATASHQTEEVVVAGIVDRIGAGDAFAAGVLHGMLSGQISIARVHAGLALTCLKHSLPGDASLFGARISRRSWRENLTCGAEVSIFALAVDTGVIENATMTTPLRTAIPTGCSPPSRRTRGIARALYARRRRICRSSARTATPIRPGSPRTSPSPIPRSC